MPTISQLESCNTESKCLYIIVVCRSPDTPAGIDRAKRYQPCLCLCLGFSQMIRILPLRLMTLHFSQIGFTDDLTFIKNTPFLKTQLFNFITNAYVMQVFF